MALSSSAGISAQAAASHSPVEMTLERLLLPPRAVSLRVTALRCLASALSRVPPDQVSRTSE